MKRNIIVLLLIAAVIASLGYTAALAGGGPGSEADPVVTKSYVDRALTEMQAFVDDRLSMSGGETLQVVSLSQGQKLIGGHGAEIILRAGKAYIIDSPGGGISDLTVGSDLKGKTLVPANHLLLVPRGDGRGIKAESDVVAMVKGAFQVE